MKPLAIVAKILLVIAIPVFIVTLSIRLLINPFYPQIEYNLPGFPPDSYGFTPQERLHWATISFNFIWSNNDIEYFNQFKLADGAPLYNDRELSHMHDVKVLADEMVIVMEAVTVLLILSGLFAWRVKALKAYFIALSRGGWLMLGIVALILLGTAFAFNWLFTEFHRIFFTGNSWLFYYSDTFIRLFPIQFWQDLFIVIGVACTILGLIFGFGGRTLARRVR
jgi:integral membrane protein (TIGR01906 family)